MNQLRERLNDNTDKESNLVKHARRELRLAGMFDNDADFGPEFAEHVVGVIAKISEGGHSGGSMELLRGLLNELLQYRPLTPISSAHEEWELRRKEDYGYSEHLWQNKRDPSAISNNGGYTWFYTDRGPIDGEHIYSHPDDEYLGVADHSDHEVTSYTVIAWNKPIGKATVSTLDIRIGPDPMK